MALAKNLAATFEKLMPPVVQNIMPHLQKVSPQLASSIQHKLSEGRRTDRTQTEIRAAELYAEMQGLKPEKNI